MPTPTAIRAAMGAAFTAHLPGVVVQANLAEVTQLGNHGGIVVGGPTADYTAAMSRGTVTWNFPIYCLAPAAQYDASTEILDALVAPYGERSVPGLVWDYGRGKGLLGQGFGVVDSTGAVDLDAHIDALISYGVTFDVVGIPHLAAVLNCVVHAPGYPT